MHESIAQSLRRLRTDAVDILFLHASRDDLRVLDETAALETLVAAKERGDTRTIGFSGYTPAGFRRALPWCDAIMVVYHPDDTALGNVIDEAADKGVTVIVKKGLASGRLAGPDAIRFILSNANVASVAIGSLSVKHMADNLRAAREVRP